MESGAQKWQHKKMPDVEPVEQRPRVDQIDGATSEWIAEACDIFFLTREVDYIKLGLFSIFIVV